MIHPFVEVSDEEENSGFGLAIVITRRWSHFGFWTRRRAIDIYTGEVADEIRMGLEEAGE